MKLSEVISASVPSKHIFRNSDFSDPRSGRFLTRLLLGKGKMFERLLFRKYERDDASYLKIVL